MRILITGSRDWDDEGAIRLALGRLTQIHGHELTIVHGACPRGTDALADRIARRWGGGMVVERHPADWRRYGKSAGFCRNAEMVELGAHRCLAFATRWDSGTGQCARLARAAGIPTYDFGVDTRAEARPRRIT